MNQPLIGIDKLLADSWNAMFKEWKPTLGWTLGMIFVPFLINIAFALPQIAEPELAQNIIFQFTGFILTWAASLYFLSGLFRYFLNKKKEASVSFQDVVSLAWIGVLMTIILIPAFLLFIIPGIWLAVAFSMAMPIYLNEGKGGWEALKTSYDIVKGRWWATVIRYIVPNLVYGIGVGVFYGIALVALIAVTMMPLSGFIHALEQGMNPMQAFSTVNPIAGISILVTVLVLFVLLIITSILLTLARMSVWTNLYKSLSETAAK